MKPKESSFFNQLDPVREKLNRFLYPSRDKALLIFRVIRGLNTIVATILILYAYGFDLNTEQLLSAFVGIDISFGVFVITYSMRVLYAFRRSEFLRTTWFEALLMILILFNGISHIILNIRVIEQMLNSFGIENPFEFYRVGLLLFLVTLIGLEFTRLAARLSETKLKPANTFISSFILIIGICTVLLMLPAMSEGDQSASFSEAFFTAVSACCVTGLIVVDTATFYSFKGQLVILIFIQLGGLGIVSFATFFATFIRNGVGLRHQTIIHDFLSTESLSSSRGLLRQIIFITFSIELIGAILIYFSWGPDITFKSEADKIFYSIFHSISSFCNAGFSLFTDGIYTPGINQSYFLQIIMATLIFFGGIGFYTFRDVFSIRRMRERLNTPWKDWKLQSKITIYTSVALVIFGTLLIALLERGGTLKNKEFSEIVILSFFQSMNARTAGFNSVDISQLATPTLIVIVFLMFVGASPGSTGGGIKTTTFYMIIASAFATIRGKKNLEIGNRSIANELVFKAFAIFSFATTYNIICIFLLSVFEPNIEISRLVFEQFSAFGTVGLSTGITAELSVPARTLIILSMFLGRIGTLTLALALSSRVISTSYKYPNEHVMVA